MIVYACPSFVIAFKPHGLPTVPLRKKPDQDTLLSRVGKLYPEALTPMSDQPWEGGTVHRLDTATEGLVLFALKQEFFDHIKRAQLEGLFRKTYTAVCTPTRELPDAFPYDIKSYFRPLGPGRRRVKAEPRKAKGSTRVSYTTTVKNVVQDGEKAVFTVEITRGFRHQIRVHLATSGYPILGDSLYNEAFPDGELQLSCTEVQFPLEDSSMFVFHS